MKKNLLAAIALVAAAGSASAEITVTGTLTADNHYAMFTNLGGQVGFVGGNELGAAGNPGAYNWSQAESWSFTAGTCVYIAAWSDKSVAQGLVGEFHFSDGGLLRTGYNQWDVIGTGIDMNDDSPYPAASLIQQQVANANKNYLWQLPYVGDRNIDSTAPWGKIAGISEDSRWMWNHHEGVSNPLVGGGNADEMLIFRFFVPTPGTGVCAALGGLVLFRRKR